MNTNTTSSWPDRALVGYVAAYGSISPPNVSNTMIENALGAGYTVFVYAFATIHETNQVSPPGGVTPSELKDQILKIHNGGSLALISFGGQNNTFMPDSQNYSGAAKALVDYCQSSGFDGIDLDLETIDVTAEYLERMILQIRQLDKNLVLTAAPQIGGGYGNPATLAPKAIFSEKFLRKVKFDALFVQEYNQYGGAVFDHLQDTEVGFITASFKPLTQIVPAETKIVIGEPANETAGKGLSNPSDIVSDLKSGDVLQSQQYGGIMTWNINYDSTQNWSFAKGVTSVVCLKHQI